MSRLRWLQGRITYVSSVAVHSNELGKCMFDLCNVSYQDSESRKLRPREESKLRTSMLYSTVTWRRRHENKFLVTNSRVFTSLLLKSTTLLYPVLGKVIKWFWEKNLHSYKQTAQIYARENNILIAYTFLKDQKKYTRLNRYCQMKMIVYRIGLIILGSDSCGLIATAGKDTIGSLNHVNE